MDQIKAFFNDPLVAPLFALLVLTGLDFLLGIYRSIQQHVFDWQKLPQILDTVVLSRVIPLAALGVAGFFVTEPAAKAGLQAAYIAGCAAALAAETAAFIEKITGGFTATNIEQDKVIAVVPSGK